MNIKIMEELPEKSRSTEAIADQSTSIDEPQIHVVEPEILVEVPQLLVEESQISVEEPQISVEEPQIPVEEPQIPVVKPQISVEQLQIHIDEPQILVEGPQTSLELTVDNDNEFIDEEIKVNDEKPKQKKRDVSGIWPFVFIIIGLAISYLVVLQYDSLPPAFTEYDLQINESRFSGQRAATILKGFTSLGERVTGSTINEVLTPAYIMGVIDQIHRNMNPRQSLSYEIQSGYGAYNMEKSKDFTYVYKDIHNVVAKLDGSGGNRSLLVNCHFDSVPSSVGASDNAGSCSVMLEMLRVLASYRYRLYHDVIFLFNGAEEPSLSGAHMFLQHPWALNVFTFINMEGMGGGGKPILFQASPESEWLFYYYGMNAEYPHAQVFAEELYQSGVIPSDTDFTIFREFKDIAGLDFAFVRNGYIHHSKYDREEYVSMSSLQVYGDDILAVIEGYGKTVTHKYNEHDEYMVFYDYVGWFMIYHTKYIGTFNNILIFIISLCSAALYSYRSLTVIEIFFSALATTLGILLGVAINILVGLFMDAVAPLSMTFYHNTFLLFPLYWIPCLVGCCLPPYLMDMWRTKKNGFNLTQQAQLNLVSFQIPWAIILFVLTCLGIRSATVIFLMLLFTSICNLFIHLIKPVHKKTYLWIWFYLAINVAPLIYLIYASMLVYILLVPMVGRSGPSDVDFLMSLVSALLALLVTSAFLPLMTLVRNRIWVLVVLCCITILTIIFATTTPIGMPYKEGPSNPAPQRFFLMHTQRNYFSYDGTLDKNDVGIIILNADKNTLRTLPVHMKQNISLLKDSSDEMHPDFITRLSTYGPSSNWLPRSLASPLPQLDDELTMKTEYLECGKHVRDGTICNIRLQIRGADRMTMFLTPKPGVNITSWSIPASTISLGTWENRPTYFIFIIMGEISTYTINIYTSIENYDANTPIMDVGLVGYATHHPELRSEEFKRYISLLPEFSTVTAWNVVFNQYVI